MTISVHSANIDADGQLIVDFLARNHTTDSTRERFDWLYRNGPAGPARVWMSRDSETQDIIGMAAAFPRCIYKDGVEVEGWVLGDFCIATQYRSLGPAVQLQRACLMGIESAHALNFDFPSATMVAVYRRLQILPRLRLIRLAKPLRVDAKISAVIKHPHAAHILSAMINTGLAIRDLALERKSRLKASFQLETCGEEFSALARAIGSTAGTCVQRSAEYLNWRYQKHPYRQYEIVTLRDQGTLVAYAVIYQDGKHVSLADMFGDETAIPDLVRSVLSLAKERKMDSVTVGIIENHRWHKEFLNMAFLPRESFPVIIGPPDDEIQRKSAVSGWLLMNGDRES